MNVQMDCEVHELTGMTGYFGATKTIRLDMTIQACDGTIWVRRSNGSTGPIFECRSQVRSIVQFFLAESCKLRFAVCNDIKILQVDAIDQYTQFWR